MQLNCFIHTDLSISGFISSFNDWLINTRAILIVWYSNYSCQATFTGTSRFFTPNENGPNSYHKNTAGSQREKPSLICGYGPPCFQDQDRLSGLLGTDSYSLLQSKLFDCKFITVYYPYSAKVFMLQSFSIQASNRIKASKVLINRNNY